MTGFAELLERQALRTLRLRKARSPTMRSQCDREFARLADMLAPRIARLIRSYRLDDMREDAEQTCALAVHRALDSYDPGRARFTTHVTWQLRGELQSLRHRVRLDHRQSARSAGIRTVSLETLGATCEGDAAAFEIADECALRRVEASASDGMALRLIDRLMRRIGSPSSEREVVIDTIFDRDPGELRSAREREQRRQIVRRTFRNCAKVLAA